MSSVATAFLAEFEPWASQVGGGYLLLLGIVIQSFKVTAGHVIPGDWGRRMGSWKLALAM